MMGIGVRGKSPIRIPKPTVHPGYPSRGFQDNIPNVQVTWSMEENNDVYSYSKNSSPKTRRLRQNLRGLEQTRFYENAHDFSRPRLYTGILSLSHTRVISLSYTHAHIISARFVSPWRRQGRALSRTNAKGHAGDNRSSWQCQHKACQTLQQ